MATYWENSCSFGLCFLGISTRLLVCVFPTSVFGVRIFFLIAPFPDHCLLVPLYINHANHATGVKNGQLQGPLALIALQWRKYKENLFFFSQTTRSRAFIYYVELCIVIQVTDFEISSKFWLKVFITLISLERVDGSIGYCVCCYILV